LGTRSIFYKTLNESDEDSSTSYLVEADAAIYRSAMVPEASTAYLDKFDDFNGQV